MTRIFDTNTNTEINRQGNYLVELLSIEVGEDDNGENQDLFVNTGFKDIIYNGQTYIAGGGVLEFSAVEETLDTKTNSINIGLNGISNAAMSIIRNLEANGVKTIGGIATISQGFWDEENGRMVISSVNSLPAVYQKWKGIIYSFTTTEENAPRQGTINVNLECKNILTAILDTKAGRFTSDNSFKQFKNTDRSMEFVPGIINFNPQFGSEE